MTILLQFQMMLTSLSSWYQENQNMLSIGLAAGFGIFIFVYLFIPLIFYFCPLIQRHIVFQFLVNVPPNFDYNSLESVGIQGGRNMYLQTEDNVTVGVWHILPRSALTEVESDDDKVTKPPPDPGYWDEALRKKGKGILIYLHGNTGTRALQHRVELYNVLQRECDFHVIAMDYRGFGDSSNKMPSETGSVLDSTSVYNWIRNLLEGQTSLPIFIWGHSLGTGIACHMVAKITVDNPKAISALFLEAPFSTFSDAVEKHRLSKLYRFLPGFKSMFVTPLRKNDIAFESDLHIVKTTVPILILHAVDDNIIPYSLGRKLYNIGKLSRSLGEGSKPIYFKRFGIGFSHKFICRSPELPALINEFAHCSTWDAWPCTSLHADHVDDPDE